MNTDKQITTKIGTARKVERSRIWIEGPRLTAHGFNPGDRFSAAWSTDRTRLVLVKCKSTDDIGLPVHTVSGKGDKPIIDITGQKVRETFGKFTHVRVSFEHNHITIEGAQ